MLAVLASLLLAAAPAAPSATPIVPDAEVPRYLRGAELSGWSSALKLQRDGQSDVTLGTNTAKMERTPWKGKGGKTPEQVKAEAEALIKAGEAKIQRANASLDGFRRLAAARFADMTKSISETVEISGYAWTEGLLVTSLRAQKAARDAGMTSQHVLGAWSFGADGRPGRSAELAFDLRAAWAKAQGDRTFLQEAPAAGYRITTPSGASGPVSFAANWTAPTATSQVALVWAEIHHVGPSASLVFVRVADAYTLRLVASECFLTTGRDSLAGTRASVVLRDEHSFLPRAGSLRLGYPREACHPLGAALIRHLCLRGERVPVPAGELLSDLLGAEPRLDDRANAIWKIRPVPGIPGDFQVTSEQVGASGSIEVGTLSLRVESDLSPAKAADAKPAAK